MKVVKNIQISSLLLRSLPDLSDVITIGYFDCYNNQLTSLQGAPKYVGRDFVCDYNQLTSLEGSPKYVGGIFYCHYNQLTSLQGAPKYVGGSFFCNNNKVKFTEDYIRSIVYVKGKVYV